MINTLTNTGSIVSAGSTTLGREGLTTNDSIINKGSIAISGDLIINGDVSTNNDSSASSNRFEISGNATLSGSIHNDQNLALTDTSTVEVVEDGVLNFNSGDTWAGEVTLTNGIINYVDLSSNGNLYALNGAINILESTVGSTVLTLINDSQIAEEVKLSIANNTTLDVSTGTLNLNGVDTWNGTILLGTGLINYNGSASTGVLKTTAGELNVLNDNTLTLKTGSIVSKDTLVNITENSTLSLTGGQANLDNADTWAGMITATSGKLTMTGDSTQAFVVNPDKLVIDSDDVITNFGASGYNSTVNFETSDVMLSLGNGKLDNFVVGNINTVGATEMTIDVDLENTLIDTIYAGSTSSGVIKVTDFTTFSDILAESTIRVIYTTSNNLTLDIADEIAVTDVRLIQPTIVNEYLVQEKGLELAKSDSSLSYYDSLTVYSVVVYDALRVLNQLNTPQVRTFNFQADNNAYEVFENLGVTTAGALNVQGISHIAGNNVLRSSLDLTGDDPNYDGVNKVSHTGFELANQTTLGLYNVDFKNTNNPNADLIKVSNNNAVINLYNSVVNGNIVGVDGATAVVNVSNNYADVSNKVESPYTVINGKLDGATLTLNGGTITFNTDTFASETSKFVANGGHVNLVDNEFKEYVFNEIVSSVDIANDITYVEVPHGDFITYVIDPPLTDIQKENIVKYDLDIKFSTVDNESDKFIINSDSDGVIFINNFNLDLSGVDPAPVEGEWYILQIIKAANSSIKAPQLAYDSSRILETAIRVMDSGMVIAADFGLFSTTTANDSLAFHGILNSFVQWASYIPTQEDIDADLPKVYTFVSPTAFAVTEDIPRLEGHDLQMIGTFNTSALDLKGFNALNIDNNMELFIQNLIIKGDNLEDGSLRDIFVVNSDNVELSFQNVTIAGNIVANNVYDLNVSQMDEASGFANGITKFEGTLDKVNLTLSSGELIFSPDTLETANSVNFVSGKVNLTKDGANVYKMNNLTSSADVLFGLDINVDDVDNLIFDVIDASSGTADGVISIDFINGLSPVTEFSETVTLQNVLRRPSGSTAKLALTQNLINTYNEIHTLENNSATDANGNYFVYHDTFIGETGLRVDDDTNLTIGILSQFKTLYEINLLSLPDQTRIYEFRGEGVVKEEVNLSVDKDGNDVGTGAGEFILRGGSANENLYVIDFSSADSTEYLNGFNLKNATTLSMQNITLQSANNLFIVNNADASATFQNVVFKNNTVALDNKLGSVTLNNVNVEAASGEQLNVVINSSIMDIVASTISSMFTNNATLTVSGDSRFENVLNNADGTISTNGNVTIITIENKGTVNTNNKTSFGTMNNTGVVSTLGTTSFTTLTNNTGAEVTFGGSVDTVGTLVNDSNIISSSASLVIDSLTNNVDANIQLLSGSASVQAFGNYGSIISAATTQIDELYNEGSASFAGGTDYIGILNNRTDATLTSAGTNAQFDSITNYGTINLNGQLDTVKTFDNNSVINTSNSTVLGASEDSVLDNAGVINLNGSTSIVGTLSKSGNLNIDGDVNISGSVSADQIIDISENSVVTIDDGILALNSPDALSLDVWSGKIHMLTGTLDYTGLTQNGLFLADAGTVNVNSGILNVANTAYIKEAVTLTVAENSTLVVSGGDVDFNSGDIWTGKVTLDTGVITYKDLTSNGAFEATSGTLNLTSGVLTLAKEDAISRNDFVGSNVVATVAKDAQVILTGGSLDLGAEDTWTGLVTAEAGNFTVSNHEFNVNKFYISDENNALVNVGITDTVVNLVDTGIGNFNMGVLTSEGASTLKVDITISNAGATGVADTITVGADSKGVIELTELRGLSDKHIITNSTAAIVQIIVRADGSESIDPTQALQLSLADELVEFYAKEYTVDYYNEELVYSNTFIGRTGVELAENNTAIRVGILDQKSTLKAANIYGGVSDNKTRTYIVKPTASSKYTIVRENVDLGDTGSGVFNVYGYVDSSSETYTQNSAKLAVIDLGGATPQGFNSEETLFELSENNLPVEIRRNGFNLVNATTINIKDLAIQNANIALVLNNKDAFANVSNVIFTGNIRAINNLLGAVTLTNVLVNEGNTDVPNDVYNTSAMTVIDSTINSLLTTENKLTVKGASILANVINSAVADVYDETLVSNLENSGTFKAYNKVVLTNVLNKTSSKIEVVDEVVVDLITNEGEFSANSTPVLPINVFE